MKAWTRGRLPAVTLVMVTGRALAGDTPPPTP
jgi:hypothetical protein